MTLVLYYQFHSEIPALPAQHLVPLCNLTQRADIGLNTTDIDYGILVCDNQDGTRVLADYY